MARSPASWCLHTARLAAGAGTALVLVGCGGSSSPTTVETVAPDVRMASWRLDLGGRYARVVETVTGTPVSTWPQAGLLDTSGGQPTPGYADVQQVSYSSAYVYVSASGLASHQMGPWYWNAATLFGNWPQGQGFVYRIPRVPEAVDEFSRVASGLGPQGAWVNGVAFFNQLDGALYLPALGIEAHDPPTADFGSASDKVWVREAIPVEGPTFDKSNAHQPPFGQYHYHSNPLALRFQTGDNVVWSAAEQKYVETTAAKKHSPILGWANDGYPIYGPYGYTDCTSGSASTVVSRMRTGFVLRNGSNGTTNLATVGRKSVGRWAALVHKLLPAGTVDANGRVALAASNHGPDVSAYYYVGRYNEDYEFLGDLGKTQAVDFDLDYSNGRTCRTPEYPKGTYAYFVTISADGSAAYPYTVGRLMHGKPSGGLELGTIAESVTDYAKSPLAGDVKLTVTTVSGGRKVEWLTAEGRTYDLEASTDGGLSWKSVAKGVAAATPTSDATPGGSGFYALSALKASVTDSQTYATAPTYHATVSATAAYANGPLTQLKARMESVTPSAVTRGTSTRLAVVLNGYQPITDFDALASIPADAVELVTADGVTVIAKGTACVRQLANTSCDFLVPTSAAAGTYMVRVSFGPPADSLQSSYQSVSQLVGVPAVSIGPGPRYVYPDLPVTVY